MQVEQFERKIEGVKDTFSISLDTLDAKLYCL